jgi:hypothetical protein
MHLHSPQNRYDARLLVISVGGAVVVGVGLLYTARNYRLSHRGQITDRFTRALEQLNAEQLYVRIGGVQALGRLMHDSPIHHDDIVEVLAAFIRDRAPVAGSNLTVKGATQQSPLVQVPVSPTPPPADVQAALTALAHRPRRPERRAIALAGADLAGADLSGANFAHAELSGADLAKANLQRADLAGANLRGVNLGGARLAGADLIGASLSLANLADADLAGADLTRAFVRSANLIGVNLSGANLRGANLSLANLTRAYFFDADLIRAYLSLAKLTDADMTKAKLRDVRGLLGEQLEQARTDVSPRLQGKFDRPRWHRTPGPRDPHVAS